MDIDVRLSCARELDAGMPGEAVLGEIKRSQEFADSSVREISVRLLRNLPGPGARCWTQNASRGTTVGWVEQNVLAARITFASSSEYGVRSGVTGVEGQRIDTGSRPVALTLGPAERRFVPDPPLAPGRHVVTAFASTSAVLQVESAVFTVS